MSNKYIRYLCIFCTVLVVGIPALIGLGTVMVGAGFGLWGAVTHTHIYCPKPTATPTPVTSAVQQAAPPVVQYVIQSPQATQPLQTPAAPQTRAQSVSTQQAMETRYITVDLNAPIGETRAYESVVPAGKTVGFIPPCGWETWTSWQTSTSEMDLWVNGQLVTGSGTGWVPTLLNYRYQNKTSHDITVQFTCTRRM